MMDDVQMSGGVEYLGELCGLDICGLVRPSRLESLHCFLWGLCFSWSGLVLKASRLDANVCVHYLLIHWLCIQMRMVGSRARPRRDK